MIKQNAKKPLKIMFYILVALMAIFSLFHGVGLALAITLIVTVLLTPLWIAVFAEHKARKFFK